MGETMSDTDQIIRGLRDEAACDDHRGAGMILRLAADEIERLRAKLPTEMQECIILFKECERGHGRLTATNWVDHGCPHCEIERLRAAIGEDRTDRLDSAMRRIVQ